MNSLEIFVLRSVTIIAVFSPGFRPAATKAYLLIFYAYSAFIHTNVAWDLECIGRFFVTTKFLHWHHDEERWAIDVNLAIHFLLLDRFFCNHHLLTGAWPKC